MYIVFAAGLVLGCVSTAIAVPSLYDEAPMADAWVDKSDPSANHGLDTSLWIQGIYGGTVPERDSYLKFDLTSIPDSAQVQSAYLGVWYYYDRSTGGFGAGDPDVVVKHVSDDSWTEGGITYNNQPSLSAVSKRFVDIVYLPEGTGDGYYVEWDLLAPTGGDPDVYSWQSDLLADLVDDRVSFVIDPLHTDLNNSALFYSREGTYAPYLRIEYTIIPAPSAFVLSGIGLGLVSWLRKRKTV
jgi:hypothetical protein